MSSFLHQFSGLESCFALNTTLCEGYPASHRLLPSHFKSISPSLPARHSGTIVAATSGTCCTGSASEMMEAPEAPEMTKLRKIAKKGNVMDVRSCICSACVKTWAMCRGGAKGPDTGAAPPIPRCDHISCAVCCFASHTAS